MFPHVASQAVGRAVSRVAIGALALLLSLGALGLAPQVAAADPGSTPPPDTRGAPVQDTPSQDQVDSASAAAEAAAGDVASVRAALVVADQRAQQAAITAAQQAENYNGARYAAGRAAAAATSARTAAEQAHGSVETQRTIYADAIVGSYITSPALGALAALTTADGISEVLESSASLRNASNALDQKYDDFRAAATIADASQFAAQRSLTAARRASAAASAARDDAEAAARAASAQSAAVAAQRDALINQLAQLQNISYALAVNRQNGLEREAHLAATKAATKAASKAAAKAVHEAEAKGGPVPLFDSIEPVYGDPDVPVPVYVPIPVLPLGPAPAPGKGAKFAIAFARAQIGEPYVWAAAGPDAWDCSGITTGAWANGGKALPHYSVAQYAASTPISPADLKPGDLVFWGKTNDPGSIYHVALYSGAGMIIQAPRSGVPVQEVSMFDWIAPNFYARP